MLFTCLQDTEEALMRAAESGPGGADGSAGRPLSVSPDYIDALVQAVREPTVGKLTGRGGVVVLSSRINQAKEE